MSFHVRKELIQFVGRAKIIEPFREEFRIDGLLVGSDHENIFNAAFGQPVAPLFHESLPVNQLLGRESFQSLDVFHHVITAEIKPALPSSEDNGGGLFFEQIVFPSPFPADESVPKTEVIAEVSLQAGGKIADAG